MEIACIALGIFWWILFARIIISWFPPPMSGFGRGIFTFLYAATDPVLRPFRNFIPPLRMGAMGLDLSPILVFIVLGVLRRVIGCGGLAI
jgi:YggT family protein